MPTVNIYFDQSLSEDQRSGLPGIAGELRALVAEHLTYGEFSLTPEEVSVRVVTVAHGEMIAPVELEISAYDFPERVEKADQICKTVATFVKQRIPQISDVQTWLRLSKLGHSWEPKE